MLKSIKNNISFVLGLLLICYISVSSTNYLIKYLDAWDAVTEYIYYRGVQSTEENFEIYKDITFASDSIVYQEVDVVWQDILRCDFYDGLGYRYYSYYESKARLIPKEYTSIWVWQWEKPTDPAKCYLDGIVLVTTDLGNKKQLHISSNEFTVWVVE